MAHGLFRMSRPAARRRPGFMLYFRTISCRTCRSSVRSADACFYPLASRRNDRGSRSACSPSPSELLCLLTPSRRQSVTFLRSTYRGFSSVLRGICGSSRSQSLARASDCTTRQSTLRFMILRTTALRRQGDGFRRYLQRFGRKSLSRRNLFSSLQSGRPDFAEATAIARFSIRNQVRGDGNLLALRAAVVL